MTDTPRGDWNLSAQLDRVEGKVDTLIRQVNKILGQELSIGKKENQVMAAVQIEQETLDADGEKLTQLAADLKSIIDGGNLPAADQSKLQAGLDALASLDTLNVTPPAPTG